MAKPWIKLACVSVFIIVSCTAYVFCFGAQTLFAMQTWKLGRQVPIVASVPRELEDSMIAQAPGEKLSFEEAQFEVPWADLDSANTKVVGNCALMKFRSGNSILLCVGPSNMFMKNLFATQKAEPELFTRIYGQEVLHSDYTLMKAIYDTTPSSITLFTSSSRAAGLASVMLIKAIAPPTTDSAIYNVRSNEFQGFQLGDPSRRPAKMCLQLYSQDIEFEFSLKQSGTGLYPAITQRDLNRIIQTAHRAPSAQPIVVLR